MFSTRKLRASLITSRFNLGAVVLLTAIALFSLPAVAQKTIPTILTSDIPDVGTFNDTNLVNPWGLSASPIGPWWISDNGTGLSTLYDGTGKPGALVVTIPSASGMGTGTPTGSIFNNTSDFKINGNSSQFLFCTEDGTISGWGSGTVAVIAVNNSGSSAVYKGCAIGATGGSNYLYVANFHAATVDIFDKNFVQTSFGSGAFTDPNVPAGFAPFNVANIGNGKLAVTYAKQDANKHDDVPGVGNGYITVYDTAGNLLFRFGHVPYNNSPWAVVVAPTGFGGLDGNFLVGEFGNGSIELYKPDGTFLGVLLDLASMQLRLDGLWGLGFGNGSGSGSKTTMYFTAGAFGEAHGTFGSVIPKTGPSGPELQVQILKQW
jgi:uncharacterized protein (TIGR03118 family)